MRFVIRAPRLAMLAIAGVFAAGIFPAAAQINPFTNSNTGRPIGQADLTPLFASVDKLNKTPNVKPGAEETWSNPATGASGTSRLTAVRKIGSATCHVIHHEIKSPTWSSPSVYDLTWCPDATGAWKIRQ
ncbi:MAG: hypothetical protein J0H67_17825 [Rhodospirillales bacterium]|nr:hypothetical protein [Rhodospirillales bacterium]